MATTGSQIIVQGQVYGIWRQITIALKDKLLPRVLESFNRLRADADLVFD